MTASFDEHADSYADEVSASVSFSGQDVDFFARRKADELVDLVGRSLGPPASLHALDVGCGTGVTDRHLVNRFGGLTGVDVAADAVAVARDANPGASYLDYDGHHLPFADDTFDVAFAICVLHHVDRPHRPAFVQEVARTVRPGGLVAIFEHNPFNPLTRVAVSRCEFDEGVELLRRSDSTDLLVGAGLTVVLRRYLIFVPVDAPWAARLDRALARVPAGGQHVVAARVPY